MRVSVIGAGAIGGWLTAGCVKAGAHATVLARGATYEALKQGGITLDDGTEKTLYPVEATTNPDQLRSADVLLLGLKAHDLPGAAPLIKAALSPDTIVVPAINGLPWWYFENFGGPAKGLRISAVDPGGVLADLIPSAQIVGSVVHAASFVPTPGTIRLVKANKVFLGDAGTSSHADTITDLFNSGGIPTETSPTLHWHVWNKLWGNATMNPLSALTRGDVSQMLKDPHVRALTKTMMQEMSQLATLIGLDGFNDPEERIAVTLKLGPIRTSMLQDVEAGRPIELDPILGGLIELAQHLGHPMPAMNSIYGMARLMDQNLRKSL